MNRPERARSPRSRGGGTAASALLLAAVLLATGSGCRQETRPQTGVGVTPRPSLPGTLRFETSLDGDAADLTLPAPAAGGKGPASLPVALLLPGANVDKGHYTTFAALLARQGFLVVVTNHWRTFPPLPLLGRRILLADQRRIRPTLAALLRLNATGPAPLRGAVDAERLVVVGHSMGGLAGLEALAGSCRFPLCLGTFHRPPELRGGVFYGTDLRGHGGGPIAPIDTDGLPVALIRGSRDGLSRAEDVEATWRQLRTPRRALLTVEGANHYGLTDSSHPVNGAGLPPLHPDPNAATADQKRTIGMIASWCARFLRQAVQRSVAPSPAAGSTSSRAPAAP